MGMAGGGLGVENKKPDSGRVGLGSGWFGFCGLGRLGAVCASPSMPSRSFGPCTLTGGHNGGRIYVAQIDGEFHELG